MGHTQHGVQGTLRRQDPHQGRRGGHRDRSRGQGPRDGLLLGPLVPSLPRVHPGALVCVRSLGKDHVMVYFSAHWCPPCRGYTPELSSAYEASAKKDKTAIVFVSSDRDQAGFDEYYGEMSFFAMPFAQRDLKGAISEKYGVRGIPTLVLLDGKGDLVEGNIRGSHGTYL